MSDAEIVVKNAAGEIVSEWRGNRSMSADAATKLRAPFPDATIGKLPRTNCHDCSSLKRGACSKHAMARCAECGNWLTTAHIHLDFVGHAAVTDRLLQVDPEWVWEPFATDTDGLPAVVIEGNRASMWIRLTILGVTRPGVGICEANKAEREKELISDALRNAAMRFGVALDLWSKNDLHAEPPPPDDPDPLTAEQRHDLNESFQALTPEGKAAFADRVRALVDEGALPQRDKLRAVDFETVQRITAAVAEEFQAPDPASAPPEPTGPPAPTPAPEPADAAEGHTGASPSDSAPPTASPAPSGSPGPQGDAGTVPTRAQVIAQLRAEAEVTVAALGATALGVRLSEAGLPLSGPPKALRTRLAEHLTTVALAALDSEEPI